MIARAEGSPVDEVFEEEAEGLVADVFSQIRQILQSQFVPTIYRKLAANPILLEAAVNYAAPLLEIAVRDDIGETIRSGARKPIVHRHLLTIDCDIESLRKSSQVTDRYRNSNPLNLIFALSVLGTTSVGLAEVMQPKLPPRVNPIMNDIKNCHGGKVMPGLWIELGDFPSVQSQIWEIVRDQAESGVILESRTRVLSIAQQFISEQKNTHGLEIPIQKRAAITEFLTWFPVGIGSMIAEGELINLIIEGARNGRPRTVEQSNALF